MRFANPTLNGDENVVYGLQGLHFEEEETIFLLDPEHYYLLACNNTKQKIENGMQLQYVIRIECVRSAWLIYDSARFAAAPWIPNYFSVLLNIGACMQTHRCGQIAWVESTPQGRSASKWECNAVR